MKVTGVSIYEPHISNSVWIMEAELQRHGTGYWFSIGFPLWLLVLSFADPNFIKLSRQRQHSRLYSKPRVFLTEFTCLSAKLLIVVRLYACSNSSTNLPIIMSIYTYCSKSRGYRFIIYCKLPIVVTLYTCSNSSTNLPIIMTIYTYCSAIIECQCDCKHIWKHLQ